MGNPWLELNKGILIILGIALVIWPIAGLSTALFALAAGLLVILARHGRHLTRLVGWLRDPRGELEFQGQDDAWEMVYSAVNRYLRIQAKRESELREEVVRLHEASHALPQGVVILDDANRVSWYNKTAQRHHGLRENDVGQPIQNLLRLPEFSDYLAGKSAADVFEFQSPRAIGTKLALQVLPFGNENKLLLSTDITERERVEIMRRDFVANVSHELKTPLTVVGGFVETLLELDLTEQQKRNYLAMMDKQVKSMQKLVEDLLILSALENKVATENEESIKVRELISAVVEDAKVLSAGQHQFEIKIDDDGAVLIGNRSELASALSNLVSNAVRYTPTAGRITVAWQRQDAGGSLSVTDTGIGIEAEHIPRLTERFYRVDRGRSRATGGTGLGLAIVRHVIMRHQATLVITSQPGKGSTFAIQFPSTRVQSAAAQHAAADISTYAAA